MKILMTAETYVPYTGGIETHVQMLSRALIDRGHSAVICTIKQKHLPAFEERNGLRIYRLEGLFQKIPFLHRKATKKVHPPVHDPLFRKALSRIVHKEGIDLIHSHDWTVYSALPLKKSLGIPIVCTLHGYHFICPNKLLMRKNAVCNTPSLKNCTGCMHHPSGIFRALAAYYGVVLNRGKLNEVSRFISVSEFTREVNLKHLGLKNANVDTIPNFVPAFFPAFESRVEQNSLSLPRDFILFVGSLSPIKGLDVLIEAYRSLKTDVKLVIIGYKHSDYHYQSTDGIIVIENLPHDLTMQAMSKCRFAVFPSINFEPFGMVAIEAMSCKKAVIASATGGLKDIIIDRMTGVLVPPGDVTKLSAAMYCLIKNPDMALEMGEKGFQRLVDHYTPEVIMPHIIGLYESLIL